MVNANPGLKVFQIITFSLVQMLFVALFFVYGNTTGILIIGQEQDSFGGGFNANQNYIGELTDLI